jgi:hypothetical protein
MSDPVQPLNPQETATAESNTLHEDYVHRVLVALDQDVNVDTGGVPDETISSRMARWANTHGPRKHIGRFMCRFLNLFQKDHGAHAEAGDYARGEEVAKLEQAAGQINNGNGPK